MRRLVGFAVAGVLGALVVAVLAQSGRELDRVEARLLAVGCDPALVQYEVVGGRAVLSAKVTECWERPERMGVLLASDVALARMAEVVWSTPAPRFDTLIVKVFRAAESPEFYRSVTENVSRDSLAARFGPRSGDLDLGPPGRKVEEYLWFLLPLALIVSLGASALLGVWSARNGVHVFQLGR